LREEKTNPTVSPLEKGEIKIKNFLIPLFLKRRVGKFYACKKSNAK